MKLDPATTMGAVTLKVADLPKLTTFYRDVVGLQVRAASETEVELGTPADTLVILRHLANGRFPQDTTGLYHLALRVPSRADLGHWLRHYAENDAPYWQGASDHGVSHALYLTDPEGNGIEIYHDQPKSQWAIQPNGRVAAFARPLDLQALIAAAPAPAWSKLPDTTDMGHVHLKAGYIGAVRPFYTELLGFDVKTVFQGSALFLAAGDYHHHLGLNTWQSQGAKPTPDDAYGLAEFALVLPDEAARQHILSQLKAANYAIENETAVPLVRDPSGNAIRLTIMKSEGVLS